jgi:hypothetical protein
VLSSHNNGLPINKSLLKQKAKYLAIEYGFDNFMASDGYIQKFKARNNIFLMEIKVIVNKNVTNSNNNSFL